MAKEFYTLITGASEGFGKALSLQCARHGMNLVLVALPGEELFQLGRYIEKEFSVKTVCLPHDLTVKEECQQLYNEISERKLAINILINNAGMGGTHFFHERNADYYHRLIQLNVAAPTLLTHLLLDDLQQNSPSHVLNVSSLAGFFYLPTKQVYGGTKSYVLSFSKSLRAELKRKNVFVTTICPGGMNTTLAQVVQNRRLDCISRWSVMNPEDVATRAIDGMLRKKEVIIPGILNHFFLLLNKIVPGWLKERITIKKLNFQHNRHQPKNRNHMKQLSTWASHNKWNARIIITVAWIVLTGLGIYAGTTLASLHTVLPSSVLTITTIVFLTSVFIYPFTAWKKKAGRHFYKWQKGCDLLIAATSFMMVVYAANRPEILFDFKGTLYAATPGLPKDSANSYKSIKDFSAAMKDANGKELKWKEKKKLLKTQLKAIRKSDEGKANKGLLVLLSVLVACGLLYLVAALSCSISCGGSFALAVIVGVGGAGLVIWLLIVTIRAIYGKNKKKKKDAGIEPLSEPVQNQ